MRKCEPKELERILIFYQRVINETEDLTTHARWIYGKHPSEEMIKDYINQDNMYCMEMDGDIVASVAVTLSQGKDYHNIDWQIDLRDDEVATAHLLAVDPHKQKRGLAKTVMNDVINIARSHGKKAVRLDALDCNTPAHRLYETIGFQKRDIRRWYAENTGWIDFYLFEYLL